MRACNGFGKGLVILVLCAAVAACGSEDDMGDGSVTGGTDGGGTGGTGGTGGGGGDAAGGSGGTAYKFLVIMDEKAVSDDMYCRGTGPGPDIDAVELKRSGSTVGVGLKGSAELAMARPDNMTTAACGQCGAQMNQTCNYSGRIGCSQSRGTARCQGVMPCPTRLHRLEHQRYLATDRQRYG